MKDIFNIIKKVLTHHGVISVQPMELKIRKIESSFRLDRAALNILVLRARRQGRNGWEIFFFAVLDPKGLEYHGRVLHNCLKRVVQGQP